MKILRELLFLGFFLSPLAGWAALPWPTQTPQQAGIKVSAWQKFIDYAFDSTQGYQTDALFVLYKGKVIHHSTAHGFAKGQVHRQWSVSKSVFSLLIGKAIEKKIIQLSTPVNEFYKLDPAFKKSPTVENLLQMTSGLKWKEGYASNPFRSDVITMLYLSGQKDMAQYAASRRFAFEAGERFEYSSGDSNLLSGILRKKMSDQDYADWPWTVLFEPLQITTATWEKDRKGTFVGSSYLYMAPEDLAKIGYLVLGRGKYFGQLLIAEEWIDYVSSLSPSFSKLKIKADTRQETYGGHWWLNRNLPGYPNSKVYSDLPEDALLAQGYQGQLMLVLPSRELVVVRNSTDRKGRLDKNKFFTLLMQALP